jgi:hypothetical protein
MRGQRPDPILHFATRGPKPEIGPEHKTCDYTFNNGGNLTKFLSHLVGVHDISYDFLIWLIFMSYRGRSVKTQKL